MEKPFESQSESCAVSESQSPISPDWQERDNTTIGDMNRQSLTTAQSMVSEHFGELVLERGSGSKSRNSGTGTTDGADSREGTFDGSEQSKSAGKQSLVERVERELKGDSASASFSDSIAPKIAPEAKNNRDSLDVKDKTSDLSLDPNALSWKDLQTIDRLADKFGSHLKEKDKEVFKDAIQAVMKGDVAALTKLTGFGDGSMSPETRAAFKQALEAQGFQVEMNQASEKRRHGAMLSDITIVPPGSNEGLQISHSKPYGKYAQTATSVESVQVRPQVGGLRITGRSADDQSIDTQLHAISQAIRDPMVKPSMPSHEYRPPVERIFNPNGPGSGSGGGGSGGGDVPQPGRPSDGRSGSAVPGDAVQPGRPSDGRGGSAVPGDAVQPGRHTGSDLRPPRPGDGIDQPELPIQQGCPTPLPGRYVPADGPSVPLPGREGDDIRPAPWPELPIEDGFPKLRPGDVPPVPMPGRDAIPNPWPKAPIPGWRRGAAGHGIVEYGS